MKRSISRFSATRRSLPMSCGRSPALKQAGTNLLAGRTAHRQMFPLLPEELGRDFDLAEVLRCGSLAVIWAAPDRREALEAYVQMYLKEEIQAESLVRNLPGFARFLPVAAIFHGQVLSVAGLARDAGVARTTVDGYLGILADTRSSIGPTAESCAACGGNFIRPPPPSEARSSRVGSGNCSARMASPPVAPAIPSTDSGIGLPQRDRSRSIF